MTGATRPGIPAAPVPSATATGPAGEELGHLVHDVRLASEAERAEAEGRQRFRLGEWEERTPWQREVDMRIGEAVAAAERERAEAKLAALRRALKAHMHPFADHAGVELCGGCLRPSPCPDAALTEGAGRD